MEGLRGLSRPNRRFLGLSRPGLGLTEQAGEAVPLCQGVVEQGGLDFDGFWSPRKEVEEVEVQGEKKKKRCGFEETNQSTLVDSPGSPTSPRARLPVSTARRPLP